MQKSFFSVTLVLLSLLAEPSISATYNCETEFGEQVPLKVIVLKKNVSCLGCEEVNRSIGKSKIHEVRDFKSNQWLYKDKSHRSKVKRRIYKREGHKVFLESRYTKIKAESFKIELKCSVANEDDSSGCRGWFLNKSGKRIADLKHQVKVKAPRVFDQRSGGNSGYALIQITRRKHFGLLARVFKQKVHKKSVGYSGISASGEIKVFSEQSVISFDSGADEQLQFFKGQFQRVAGFEVKIECEKQ